jgi:hypothetical protein
MRTIFYVALLFGISCVIAQEMYQADGKLTEQANLLREHVTSLSPAHDNFSDTNLEERSIAAPLNRFKKVDYIEIETTEDEDDEPQPYRPYDKFNELEEHLRELRRFMKKNRHSDLQRLVRAYHDLQLENEPEEIVIKQEELAKMMKDVSIEDQTLFAYKMEHWKATEIARPNDDTSNATEAEEERLVFSPQDIHAKETVIQSQFD